MGRKREGGGGVDRGQSTLGTRSRVYARASLPVIFVEHRTQLNAVTRSHPDPRAPNMTKKLRGLESTNLKGCVC